MLGANAARHVPAMPVAHVWQAADAPDVSSDLQDLMQGLWLDAGTKGTAKALEEIQLLEERGAALAAEADEAEALHTSTGDPMTRLLHTPPPPRHIFLSHRCLHQTCDSRPVLHCAHVACALLQTSAPCCCRHEKAVGTLREETRALRLLTQQAVEERAEVAARSLVSILAPVPHCPTVPTAFHKPSHK